jgi:D-alanyl-D-alanine carboxypeptidase/D-alanyl-D-alanine-endopeptidase (penicillin-binding protein 4)
LRFFLAALLPALLCNAPAMAAQKLPAEVAQALQQAHIPPTAMATFVQEVSNKRSLLDVHGEQAMTPASVIKLVTSYAALEQFGPAQRFKTSAYSNAPLQNGVLQGDLVLQGGGDPKLVLESFWLFLRQLRQIGVRDIKGNLLLDRSLFQMGEIDAAEFDGDPARAYNVGPDALLLNFKTIRLRFEPDPASAQVRVSSEPALDGVGVKAPLLGAGECVDWHEQLQFEWQGRQLQIKGQYPASCGVLQWAIHPHGLSANQYLGALFQTLWRELGGTFSGQVIDGKVPPDARLLAQWESPPLAEMMRDMNKFSNNVMARHLLILLAARGTATAPASAPVPAPAGLTSAQGAAKLLQWLQDKGLSDPQLLLENGAGLSNKEQLSAKGLARILLAAYRSPWMPEMLASLPVVAYDGTMRKRLKESAVAGQAHIKTGTLTGVRSIAGYVRARSGKIYVVTSLINHANAGKGQAAHDLLLQWVYDKG